MMSSFTMMGKILDKDAEVKRELDTIYRMLLELLQLKNFDERLRIEVQAEFGNFLDQLRQYSDNLRADECPIVVAGTKGLSALIGSSINFKILYNLHYLAWFPSKSYSPKFQL